MQKLLLFFAILLQLISFGQDRPQEVTPAIQKTIKADIDKGVLKLKAELKKDETSALQMEFTIDTFRVEKYFELYMKYDYSTAGMVTAGYEAAHSYDSLLNKYYKKLLNKLKPADRSSLIQAQKAWIAFRDAEEKLISTVSKDEYSGGGTIQGLIDSSDYLELIKQRLMEIFNHLDRIANEL
jgi:uncharacterized protein YecT (DUF1311 family)